MKRRVCFGDVHGRLDALKDLYAKLEWESVDEIYHLGDLVDRGPDSIGVVRFCIEKGIKGIIGNHEGGLIEKHLKTGIPHAKNPDKIRTFNQIYPDKEAVAYLESLPDMLLFEDANALLVHAGLWPWASFYDQPNQRTVQHIGMAHKNFPGASRWRGYDKRRKKSEEEHRAEGWVAWNEAYDGSLDIYCGHSVLGDPITKPFIHKGDGGAIYFLDTGAYFTGVLTACIFPEGKIIQTNCGPMKKIEAKDQD